MVNFVLGIILVPVVLIALYLLGWELLGIKKAFQEWVEKFMRQTEPQRQNIKG